VLRCVETILEFFRTEHNYRARGLRILKPVHPHLPPRVAHLELVLLDLSTSSVPSPRWMDPLGWKIKLDLFQSTNTPSKQVVSSPELDGKRMKFREIYPAF